MKTNSGGELQMSKKTEESNFLFCGNQECPNLIKKKTIPTNGKKMWKLKQTR